MNDTKTYLSPYTKQVAQLTKQGMEQAILEGKTVGTIPLGYEKDQTTKKIVKDLDRAWKVELAFKLIYQGKSLRQVCTILEYERLTTKKGNPLGSSTLHHMLSNPFYAGCLRFDGRLYKGEHEPIIPLEAFEKVQEKIGNYSPYESE